ncbi:MAG: hypothetical protein OSJ55_09940, partial [Bacteroidales bacterium]|nr:hypothetical protein [Bacteroidales bacterium]
QTNNQNRKMDRQERLIIKRNKEVRQTIKTGTAYGVRCPQGRWVRVTHYTSTSYKTVYSI